MAKVKNVSDTFGPFFLQENTDRNGLWYYVEGTKVSIVQKRPEYYSARGSLLEEVLIAVPHLEKILATVAALKALKKKKKVSRK